MRDRHCIHASISINGHKEADHVSLKIQINHSTLDGRVKLSQLTTVVNAVVIPHDNQLRITLTTVTRLSRGCGLSGETTFNNDNVLEELVPLLEDSMIHTGAILGMDNTNTIVFKRVVFELINIEPKNVSKMFGGRHVLSITCHHPICHHKQNLVLVWVGSVQNRLDRFTQLIITLIITRHHNHHRTPYILFCVSSVARTNVYHGCEELNDHQESHETKH
mmetsp:Transcript_27667/g.41262  ORF Transcript_27667/g.41262 Transcript_27667/m.41262 type:complete len:220 (+) Transcript_27667:1216-1875(+)